MARLIDADATIDRYYAEWEYHCIKMGEDDRQWLRQCIDQAPTIDAKPMKHGRFEWSGEKDEWYAEYATCLDCGAKFMVCDKEDYKIAPTYCPNCGTDM